MAGRNYQNDYPSVTQLIGQLSSPGLINWFKWNTPQFIKAESEKGKLIGSQIHTVIQQHIDQVEAKIETEYPDEVTTALKSFMLFKKERPEIKLIKAEITLTSEKYLFNGQTDCLAEKEKIEWVADWKSQNVKDKEKPVIYDEAKIQTAAYCHLINECQNKSIGNAIIVALAKDKIAYETYEMGKEEIDGWFNEVFLPLLKIYYYRKGK